MPPSNSSSNLPWDLLPFMPTPIPPWAHLPDDVLEEVFTWTVIGADEYFARLVLDSRKLSFARLPQLTVSHLCTSWRRVALLTRRLWNRVWIKELTQFNSLIATEWLSRARDVPLTVVVGSLGEPDDEGHWRSWLIDLLSLGRLQHLHCSSELSNSHLILHNLPSRSVADLESLKMDSGPGSAGYTAAYLELNEIRYPKLVKLSLAGTYEVVGSSYSLRVLDAAINPWTIAGIWEFLRACPALVECYLTISAHNSRTLPLVGQIKLPFLRILRLTFYHGALDVFDTFIQPLSLPRLERFEIGDSSIRWSISAFESLARRSDHFPHLVEFTLRNSRIMVDAGPLLTLLPSIVSMSLCCVGPSTGEAIFDKDTLHGIAVGSLGPQLRSLIVGRISNTDQFMDMVESRMEAARASGDGTPVPFTAVKFSTHQRYGSISSRVRSMRERGIPIDAR